jgi:hypothetical protein
VKLTLFTESIRGRKAYKDDTGKLFLECVMFKAIKLEYDFQKEQTGFLGRRYNCYDCKNEQNKIYRMRA